MKKMQWIHKITRPEIEEVSLYGFVLRTSDNLTLIAEEVDLLLDGFKVIRNQDIKRCKPNATTRFGTRIMEKEGLVADTSLAKLVDISDWHSLLKGLKSLGEWVIVEDEVREDFLIGPLHRVNRKSVAIDYFTGDGKWTGPSGISFDCITSVTFRSRYINMYRKYLEPQKRRE